MAEQQIEQQPVPGKRRFGKLLSIALPLLLGFFLIIYQYNQFTPEQLQEMKSYFRTADYFYIGLSLVVALFGYLSRAHRWTYSLRHMGYQSSFKNNLLAVCISYFINLTIPRSGEISRAVVLKKYENVPFDKAFGSIVAERVVDLIIFFLFVVLALAFQFNVLKEYIVENIPLGKLAWLVAGSFGFLLLGIFLWFYSRWTLIERLKIKVSGVTEGFMSVFKMRDRWAYLFHSFFIWFTYLLMFYVTIYALPETSNIGIGAVITGFVMGSLANGFTNSGFGAFPLLIAQIFLLYGVAETVGTAFGWLVWISQTLLMVVLGLVSFILLPILNRNK
ncbi:MAG: flippase-like domain-containing protein [Flavobacterium sp.]|nr:MAG: flippase-like domain-containing protein [Flavobacterium sp.]